jgi:coenzyme F420 biosynthesis associated uncharacterized protein
MEMVDWDLAVATARRLVRPGPAVSDDEATATVRQLRELAVDALGYVTAYTGLVPDPALKTGTEVVDRSTWAEYNVAGMRETLAPVFETLGANRGNGLAANVASRAGRAVTGAELGGVLSFLASHVLGQYEVFLPPGAGDGRLLLVAPNIVDVERRLDVDPRDFRMWVCLHEQTHHVQFTGAPWLRDHVHGLVRRLAEASNLDAAQLLSRLKDAVRDARSGSGHAGTDGDDAGIGLIGALQTPAQRALLTELQAVMTLLEGHADQVMDAIGPQAVPSVAHIRAKFDERRRRGMSPLDRFVRKILGVEAKLAQYRVGGAFCRAVTLAGGPAAMRVAFADPAQLPSMAELRDPPSWLARTASLA